MTTEPASSQSGLSSHAIGLLLTTAGVLVLTPDSLLIRLVDADAWTIIFWRGLLMGLTIVVGIFVWMRGGAVAHFRSIGTAGLVVAVLFASQLTLFTTSITQTSVANTLVIFATAPLFAAVLSRFFLGELVPLRVWLAVIISLGAIVFIFFGSIGTGRIGGDLAAAGAALAMAIGLTIMRRSSHISMIPAWGMGALLAAGFTVWFAEPLSIPGEDVAVVLPSGMLVLPVAFALIALGPRRISAPETGLLMLLETTIGPLWVWWILEEQPNSEALIGGAIVVAVLAVNSLLGLRRAAVA
ncbi:DMT family transporter [Candidatus Poriferisocius sp.]|uniref:DMT family transporter n=1 Tax=Candidatus Poriferisocius sp. TaxID=3101276 RepID=UPI003B58BA2C